NLFPHLTVVENLMLAPRKVLNLSVDEGELQAMMYLKKVGLEEKAKNYPDQLSGGQKQRVAIARSLCMNPEVILFDEPTSALDPELAYEVLKVIEDLAKGGMTMIIVTHSMHFAKRISDQVLFLKEGKIVVQGTPEEIFTNPQNKSLKSFLAKVKFA
ncbi:MAG: amino acid ABC transporter ATP-binding protein, partial [Microcystis aeruginosa]